MTQFGVKSLWQSGEGRCTNTKQNEDYYHRVEFHIWNTNVQLYLSHTWPHSHRSMGYKLFPVSASNTLRVNERHSWRKPSPPFLPHYSDFSQCCFQFTVSHCADHSSFPLPWRLVLCGNIQSAAYSSLTRHSLGPNGGKGVLMTASGLFRRSGVTHTTFWEPYYKSVLYFTHTPKTSVGLYCTLTEQLKKWLHFY